MRINWKVRALSLNFWLALVPAVLLVVQTVASMFGYQWNFIVLDQQLSAVINSIFAVLAILGVVVDPTTPGLNDSQLVLSRSAQTVVPRQSVQVPNPNPQGQPIPETPLIKPISSDETSNVPHETQPVQQPTDDVSHETAENKAGDANVIQH